MSARILPRDQDRQFERFTEADAPDLLRSRFGDEQVPVLEPRRKTVRPCPARSRLLLPGAETTYRV